MKINLCKYRAIDKWGIYDTVKELFVIEPIYSNIFYCPETDLFLASLVMPDESNKWGFINDSNEVVIPFQFEEACTFSDGLALVSITIDDDYKYGFIDKTGNYVIPCEYDYASSFNKGFAIVSIGGYFEPNNLSNQEKVYTGGKYTLINKFNQKQFDFEFDSLEIHEDESSIYWTCGTDTLLIVDEAKIKNVSLEKNNRKYDFIKYAGNGYFIGISQKNKDAFEYEDLYHFIVAEDGGLITDSIQNIEYRESSYNYCTKFYEGIAAVKIIDKRYKSKYYTRELFTNNFDYESINHDFINIPTSLEYWYFINTEFNRICNQNFEEVGFFREGLCPVKISGKWGYIDQIGNMKIPPKYEYAKSYNNGIAAVKTDSGVWALLNREGVEVASNIKADSIGDFNCGLFWIRFNTERFRILNLRKRLIDPNEETSNKNTPLDIYLNSIVNYDKLEKFQFGFIDVAGNIVIAPKYHGISDFKNGIAAVSRNGNTFWINEKGKEYISFKSEEFDSTEKVI